MLLVVGNVVGFLLFVSFFVWVVFCGCLVFVEIVGDVGFDLVCGFVLGCWVFIFIMVYIIVSVIFVVVSKVIIICLFFIVIF